MIGRPRQRADFTVAQINAHAANLAPEHVEILRTATPGKNYRAIGMELNLPKGTVKSRLNRARAALSRLIEGQRELSL